MKKSAIVYVDGFNLYNGIHDIYGHKFLWLDLLQLVQNFRKKHEILSVKYFTAPLLNDPGAQSRQAIYWNALKGVHGERVQIVEGRYQRSDRKCRECAHEWPHYEEKETDVNLALSIVLDSIQKPATDYFLITGDSDAAPAIRQAQKLNPDGFYMALFPPMRQSFELQALMPNSMVIGESRLRQAQLPEEIVLPSGQVLEQPQKWRPSRFLDPDFFPPQPRPKVTASPGSVARVIAAREGRSPL